MTDEFKTREKMAWSAALSTCIWNYGLSVQESFRSPLSNTFEFHVDNCFDNKTPLLHPTANTCWRMQQLWGMGPDDITEEIATSVFSYNPVQQKQRRRSVSVDTVIEDDATTDKLKEQQNEATKPKIVNKADAKKAEAMMMKKQQVPQKANVRNLSPEEQESMSIRMTITDGVLEDYVAYSIAMTENETGISIDVTEDARKLIDMIKTGDVNDEDMATIRNIDIDKLFKPESVFVARDSTLSSVASKVDCKTIRVIALLNKGIPFRLSDTDERYKLVSGVLSTKQGIDAFVVSNKILKTCRGRRILSIDGTDVMLALYISK